MIKKLLSVFLIISILCCIYFFVKIVACIFIDEVSPDSCYDEVYINNENEVFLLSDNYYNLQVELINIIQKYKNVENLDVINIRLDNKSNVNSVSFNYRLNDIDNYNGKLEVNCVFDEEKWHLRRVESKYYYGNEENKINDNQLIDISLYSKVKAIIEEIKLLDLPEMEVYSIKIVRDYVYIHIYNWTEENQDNNYFNEFTLIQEDGEYFLKEIINNK